MRLLTFSFLKSSKLKTFWHRLSRQLNDNAAVVPNIGAAGTGDELLKTSGETSLVEIAPSWPVDDEPELRAAVLRDMQVFPDFVSEAEEASLMDELEPYLKRMRYEFDHWDNAIEGYRETERRSWRPANEALLQRVRAHAFPRGAALLPHAHVLDLAPGGHIKPHVDALRFCGDVIAGLSLCSAAVMRLQHSAQPHRQLDALLARRSLYVMRDLARYSFSHAVLGAEASAWRGARVPRRRRVALICRAQPHPHPHPHHTD